MNQIYKDNTKRPKWKENQLGILGISVREFTHFADIQQRVSDPGQSTTRATYQSIRINPKLCWTFP